MNKYFDKAINTLLKNKNPNQIKTKNIKEYDTIDLLFFNSYFAKLSAGCYIFMHIYIIVWCVMNFSLFKALILFSMARSLISVRKDLIKIFKTKICLYDVFYPLKELI